MAEQDMEEDLNPADYEVGSDATDLPITQRGLDIASLLQSANTGAQGRAMPSYAADAANANTRVAQALERSLRQAEEGGLRRIGAALTADIASSGRTPYGATMERLEASDIQREMQAAQTLQGIDRATANLLQRRSEAAARAGNAKAQRINEMIRAAASGFEDPVAAQERMYQFLATRNRENPNLDLNELPGLMAEAISDARRAGLRRAPVKGQRAAGAMAGEAPATSAMPMKEDGTPDYTKPFAKPKSDFERTWNMATPEERKGMREAYVAKQSGRDVVAERKSRSELNAMEAAAVRSHNTINEVREQLSRYGGSVVGPLGALNSFVSGFKQQVDAAMSQIDNREVRDTLEKYLSTPSSFPNVPTWVETGTAATFTRALFVELAYALASAREPGGRLTEQDVKRAARSLGETTGDVKAIQLLFDRADKDAVDAINFKRKQMGIAEPFAFPRAQAPKPTAGQPSPQPPAPQPQPAQGQSAPLSPAEQEEFDMRMRAMQEFMRTQGGARQ